METIHLSAEAPHLTETEFLFAHTPREPLRSSQHLLSALSKSGQKFAACLDLLQIAVDGTITILPNDCG
jgi:hypothetical protein